MSLGDPFGRVARRRTAAYTQLREELQRQGIRSGADIERDWPRMLAIPRAILASQFVGVIEGRNDL